MSYTYYRECSALEHERAGLALGSSSGALGEEDESNATGSELRINALLIFIREAIGSLLGPN